MFQKKIKKLAEMLNGYELIIILEEFEVIFNN